MFPILDVFDETLGESLLRYRLERLPAAIARAKQYPLRSNIGTQLRLRIAWEMGKFIPYAPDQVWRRRRFVSMDEYPERLRNGKFISNPQIVCDC